MLQYPQKYVWISKGISGHGYNAYDFGWMDYDERYPDDTGQHPNLYPMSEGIVLYIDNSKSDVPDKQTYGNQIIIYYPEEDKTSRYAHIKKDSFYVKVGDAVTHGMAVCKMGNSGNSYGCHNHCELYNGKGVGSKKAYAIDYLPITYATEWNIVDPDTVRDYDIRYRVIEPVAEDVTIDQVYVSESDSLRIRTEPSLAGDIVGYAEKGFYNISGVAEMYWCRVGDYWINGDTLVSEIRNTVFFPSEQSDEEEQIEVTIDNLRIRKQSTTESDAVGFCPTGFYTVYDEAVKSDYTWYQICGYWVAGVDGVIHHKGDKDAEIERLKAIVKEQEQKIAELSKQIETDNAVFTEIRDLIDRVKGN